ncbi:hypothetical protein AAK917_10670 [Oscillospiraceae bacterium 52-8]
MRQQKRAKRRGGQALAASLAALTLLGTLSLTGGRGTAGAAGETTDQFIGATDLTQVFTWNNVSGFVGDKYGVHDNNVYISDATVWTPHGSAPDRLKTSISQVHSKGWLSLQSDWTVDVDFTMIMTALTTGSEHISIALAVPNGKILSLLVWKVNGNYEMAFYSMPSPTQPQTLVKKVDLTKDYFNQPGKLQLQYSSATQQVTATLQSGGQKATLSCSPYVILPAGTETAQLAITGGVDYPKELTFPGGFELSMKFNSAAYTRYYPEFVETKLLKADGSAFDEGEVPVDGDTVVVQATVRNINKNAAGQAIPCTLKLLQGNRDYPTAGIVPLTKAEGQEIKANGTVVDAGTDIANAGIPFKMTGAGNNVITYRAKIANPSGAAVTVGQQIADTFFQSRCYSKAELVPAVELVPFDPNAEPEPDKPTPVPGTDYHYTRTPANENGWNRGPVEVTFCPGTFDQFHIKKGTGLEATLDSTTPQKQYAEETDGISVTYQARDSGSGAVSTTASDTIRVDITAPALAAAGGDLTLTDGLSGVWKLERQNPATKAWETVQAFALTDGSGAATQTVAPAKNGLYRALDAAGNPSAPLAVTVSDPPSVDPADPDRPGPSGPETQTDAEGLVHAVYTDQITQLVTDPPAFGGTLTADKLREIIASRYTFGAGSATLAMTRDGRDISAIGLPTTAPGACLGSYTVTDADGNTTTLQLTYAFVEKPKPPAILPTDPEDPPQGPQEVIDPDNTVHHTYTDRVAELITDPPAHGGSFTRGDALQYIRDHYDFAAQGSSLIDHTLRMEQGGALVEGISTAVPGSCLITYTVKDRGGNTTTLVITYAFAQRTEPPVIAPADPERPLPAPEETVDKGGAVHHSYWQSVTEPVAYPPAFDGTLTAEKALAWVRQNYRVLPGGAGLGEEGLILSQNGQDITSQGFATDRAGSCLITYRVVDEYGNSATLYLTYTLTDGSASGDVTPLPDGGNGGGQGSGEGTGPYTGEGAPISSCGLHWLALLVGAVSLLYALLLRRGRERLRWWDNLAFLAAGGFEGLVLLLARCPLDLPAVVLGAFLVALAALLAGSAGRRAEDRPLRQ